MSLKPPVVVIGLGEIGSVIARGCLRLGHPVFPVVRDTPMQEMAELVPTPAMVVVATGEAELHTVLKQIPESWRNRLLLIQNELLPRDWETYEFTDLSVASIWFEKKQGMDSKVLLPSVAWGPAAPLLKAALATLDIPVRVLADSTALLQELVVKNLYILTTNIAGLVTGGTVSELWSEHRAVAEAVFDDVLKLQQALTGEALDRAPLLAAMLKAFEGDPNHRCMGRSAAARLKRALQLAHDLQVEVPTLEKIAADHDIE